jgi:hypothetical protein
MAIMSDVKHNGPDTDQRNEKESGDPEEGKNIIECRLHDEKELQRNGSMFKGESSVRHYL